MIFSPTQPVHGMNKTQHNKPEGYCPRILTLHAIGRHADGRRSTVYPSNMRDLCLRLAVSHRSHRRLDDPCDAHRQTIPEAHGRNRSPRIRRRTDPDAQLIEDTHSALRCRFFNTLWPLKHT